MPTKRFNDGVIDLSSLKKTKEEKAKEELMATYNPEAIMASIPTEFQAKDDEGEEVTIQVISVAVMPEVIYMVLTDNKEDEPPFLMLATHTDNAFNEDLRPATEEDLEEYNALVVEYRASQETESNQEYYTQLQEMLEKAETDEERAIIQEQINKLN